ncbi:proline dehydrogenase family protein [Actinomyces vulturis]|uniref:proline dehydrogenase family protein n=1 Tax=Actinomyces vulturis TaxID=1857645 RepID=UPI0008322E13|nr:proline dehydrogenase family protein [Actinomyces vulturis]
MTDYSDVPSTHTCPDDLWELGQRAVERARGWVDESVHQPTPLSAQLLSRVLADPEGLDFTTRFVDDVVRPVDLKVAGQALRRLSMRRTDFLPAYLAAAVKAGGVGSRIAPEAAAAIARRTFRELVGDLVVDATEDSLGPALARLRATGNRLNVNLLGEAVLGEAEAERRLADVERLVRREDVDYVSIKVSAVTGPHNPWGFNEVVQHGVEQLAPLYRVARDNNTFLNLDMEDYKDLQLTLDVFMHILDEPDLKNYEAGIVLQAYLPDTMAAMQRLQDWAAKRVASGGSRIKVRLVKGANLAMERVDAEIHGWELTTWPSKQATDTNYKRVLSWALRPERTKNIRLGVAGQNLFDVAFARELSLARGVADDVEFEMLSGMATGQAEVVRRDVGHLLLYVPVVSPSEFDVAIAYLVRRLEENAMPTNFMSGVFDLAKDDNIFNRERNRFLGSLADVDEEIPAPNRTQDRANETADEIRETVQLNGQWHFENTADTDLALPANQAWAREIADRIASSTLGVDEVAKAEEDLSTIEAIDELVDTTRKAGENWANKPAKERSAIIHEAGVNLGLMRAALLEVAASEAGKTLDQSDPEVSEAMDFCHYYAQRALELERLDGARFVPSKLVVVASPWNFPVAIPTGGVAAALAAGSPVVLKPAPPVRRCAMVLAQAFWDAGVPRDVLRVAPIPDSDVSKRLIVHPDVERVILTGATDTAQLFRSWRKDLPLLGETSGKNAIIVTPSADPDLAVRDVVASAFAHAGQKCSAASLLILVASAGRSSRIARQLVDATASLRIGKPEDLSVQVGPMVMDDDPKARRGLEELGHGEHWVLRPKYLGGGLWRPGIRAGVTPGSDFHHTEYFAPVLGVMRVDTLEEAINVVNDVDYGLTSGLHTLDERELDVWLENIEAGNLYVNRSITGAIVRRQPFGGWKRSAIGSTTKAGGPSYLLGLGHMVRDDEHGPTTHGVAQPDPFVDQIRSALAPHTDDLELAFFDRSIASDSVIWSSHYGQAIDESNLACERNILRYRPIDVVVRAEEGAHVVDIARVIAAGVLTDSPMTLSVNDALPMGLSAAMEQADVEVIVENDSAWRARLATMVSDGVLGARVRVISARGADYEEVWARTCDATSGSPDVAVYAAEVTSCGRAEMLPFVHEQSVAITNHRFGTPFDLARDLI